MLLFLFIFSGHCILEEQILEQINKYRIKRGLKKLEKDDKLQEAASVQATYMKRINTLTHFGQGINHTLLQRIQNSHYKNLKKLGQYIFMSNDLTPLSIMQNILVQNYQNGYLDDDFENIGIGHSETKSGKSYWAIVFGSKFNQNLITAINL